MYQTEQKEPAHAGFDQRHLEQEPKEIYEETEEQTPHVEQYEDVENMTGSIPVIQSETSMQNCEDTQQMYSGCAEGMTPSQPSQAARHGAPYSDDSYMAQIQIQQNVLKALACMEYTSEKLNLLLYKRQALIDRKIKRLNEYYHQIPISKEDQLKELVEHYSIVKNGITRCSDLLECLDYIDDVSKLRQARQSWNY
ncbi:unnamed protein product [Moneuplotes crassus]|uniref:Uncharacterized protein n=1 Tax=Euplotes crassus TaxID=5936 RepID=A0AAD2D4I1_EUPCR|nr:unnamed protein product [Moneuplotes crassus]